MTALEWKGKGVLLNSLQQLICLVVVHKAIKFISAMHKESGYVAFQVKRFLPHAYVQESTQLIVGTKLVLDKSQKNLGGRKGLEALVHT